MSLFPFCFPGCPTARCPDCPALRHSSDPPILKPMLNQSPVLDRVFQALADPTRRDMVQRLSHGPASVSELARPLEISLPAVLQHLQVLESSGLVRTRKKGRVRICQIEPKALGNAEQWIAATREEWERRLDRLGAYLAEQADSDEPT